MKQKIKAFLSIKISAVILLTSNRLLAKYKYDKDSSFVEIKEHINNNAGFQKKCTSNNEVIIKGINMQSNRSSLNKAQYYTEVTDYDNGIFDGKYFHIEKKLIKKKDYDNFL
ncbi:fam-m protein [Plasmodium brasilianum]|uniref:Fam-m protein n=1 Tax=Plasmodium brasilianum TaxID=5824 RepID=A0ACB9Y1M2_PLABR|nr:fam-m protein [Plasmodium brasilianum]